VPVPEAISYKLRRAHKQLETLNASAEGFLEADPKPYRVVPEDDPNTRQRIYWMEIIERPPVIEWAVLTGEIVYHLRSSLDHLAWELCLAHAPGRTPPRGTAFPIIWDEDRFDDLKPGGGRYQIRGMSWEVQHAIRAEQPYERGNPPKSQSIWVLQAMANVDKHRHLHFAAEGHPGAAFFVDDDVEIVPVFKRIDTEDRFEIARAIPLTPEAEVKNDPIFFPQIVFDESSPAAGRSFPDQLQTFEKIVTKIVTKLSDRFLTV
jgi:hypothetical protein